MTRSERRRSSSRAREPVVRCFIEPSRKPDKKYDAVLLGRTVSFGAKGMSDFTLHQDPLRKDRYLARHSKREHWSDPLTPGFWSRWLLWNKKTLGASAKDVRRRFGISVLLAGRSQRRSSRTAL